jgi:ADP-heptose:LPS heptosyltransferase/glycosyltransferase involved in cell wall biosynthesis
VRLGACFQRATNFRPSLPLHVPEISSVADALSASPPLSVVIITRNEAHNIGACIEAALRVSSDIVVVDSHSSDRTRKISEQAGARVFLRKWEGYSATKNWANDQAQEDWILSVDADEVLSDTLISSIISFLSGLPKQESTNEPSKKRKVVGAQMNRLTQYCGVWVWHSGWYPDRKVRLWRKGLAHWEGDLHEQLIFSDELDGEVVHLAGNLLHFSYPSAQTHYDQIEKFGRIWAESSFSKGRRVSRLMGAVKVVAQWIKTYLVKGGFRDGRTGWVIARRSAFATRRKLQMLRGLWRGRPLKRVLVCRTDAIGDVVLSLPIAAALKAARPSTHVAFCVRPYAAPVVACSPFVDEVILWDSSTDLGAGRFDAAVLAFPDRAVLRAVNEASIGRVAATGRRLHTFFGANDRTWGGRKRSVRHEAEHGFELLDRWGIMPVELTGATRLEAPQAGAALSIADSELVNRFIGERPPVLLHPGSHGSAGNLAIESYAQLADMFVAGGRRVVITGTEDEGREFRDAFNWQTEKMVDSTGQLSLTQLIALISRSQSFVASSTGPLHIAAGCGTRCLGLYQGEAPMWAKRWAPLGPRAHWLTAPGLNKAGHLDLSAEEIHAALETQL